MELGERDWKLSACAASLLVWISLAFAGPILFLFSLLVVFSWGYILNFKRFQGRISVSQKLVICLKWSGLPKTITTQKQSIYKERFFLDWKDVFILAVTVKGNFTAIHIASHPCSWYQSNICCLSKRRYRNIHYSILYRKGKKKKKYFQNPCRTPHQITYVFKKKHGIMVLMSYCYFLEAQMKCLVLCNSEISKQPCLISTVHQTPQADFWFSWSLRIYTTDNSHASGHIQSGNE